MDEKWGYRKLVFLEFPSSHGRETPEPLNWTLLRGDSGGNVEISNGPSRSECQLALVHHVLQWKFDRQMKRGKPALQCH
jgi:hypothetical protein